MKNVRVPFSYLMLVAARLRHIAGTKWGTRRYLDMTRLRELRAQAAAVGGPAPEGRADAKPALVPAG
jgi:hypothetical protein